MFKAYEIKPEIYWVGVLEWNERYIHGFSMHKGSTNNAYLILDEKITLIDTCQNDHKEELLQRISDIIDPADIDIVISNHSEKDHAGSLGAILDAAPNATIVTSDPKGFDILKRYYGEDHEFLPVINGDELSIGKRTLKFIHTPMVHWPDNMVTYSEFDNILFSNDAFGQFICTSKRFDEEIGVTTAINEAKKYFANIVVPFTMQTKKAIDAVKSLDELDMIAPSHGIIWRDHINKIISHYERWCDGETTDSAVVVYSSMYGSTEEIAQSITEGFMHKGIEVRMYDLMISDIADIMTDVLDAKYVAVGSSTHNMTTLPIMGQFLTYLKGLAPRIAKNKIGIAFGSFGWAALGAKEIASVLETTGFKLAFEEPIVDQWDTKDADEDHIFKKICELVENSI